MPTDKDQAALQALERAGKARANTRATKRKNKARSSPQPALNNADRTANTLSDGSRTNHVSQVLFLLLPIPVAGLVYWTTTHAGIAVAAFAVASALGFGLLLVIQRRVAKSAVAHEQAWLDALPFAVLGWFAALVDAKYTEHAEHVMVSSHIDVQIEDSDRKTNALYLHWQRAVMAQVVQPLHEAYAVERIRFERA